MDAMTPGGGHRDIFELAALEATGRFEGDVARRTVRVGAIVAAIVLYLFAGVYALGGPAAFILPNMLAATALVAVALLRFRSWNAQLYAGNTIGLALLATHLFLLGRIDTGSTVWFLVPAGVAMLVGASRMAIYCATITVCVLVGVNAAVAAGIPGVGTVELPNPQLVMGMSMVGALVATGAVSNVALRARHSLMADVEARTVDLAAALQEAQAARSAAVDAAEAKERFFANLTHEIRTPLSGIAGTAELLHASDLPADERAMADAMVASTRGLVTLVNTMLAHARLRAQRVGVERGPVDIRAVAADVEALFRAQATDKGLVLAVTVDDALPRRLETDGVKLGQVIGNLVGNAVKFTEHGRIDVAFGIRQRSIDESVRSPGRLTVCVTDTGMGIPADLVADIFEPFVQADPSMTRTHGGTGLGLAIASQLAELLGGTLTVDSRLGAGSTFTLDVPFAPATSPAIEVQPAAPAVASSWPRVRVLLADDNDVNRIVASRMLGRLGADVVVAEDGATAVRLARDGGIELILMDLQMPGMDGISAAREIRRWETERGATRTCILAMTGNAPEDYGDACEAAGMDGFVTKPVDMSRLRELLERVSRPGGVDQPAQVTSEVPAAATRP
jgi:signal transduction histidine kinase/ActR/RegA family two-component response regulator